MLEAHKYLRKYSIKPSVQRSAVMNFLMNNHIHPTIDEIYMALLPSMPTLSKTTVYNTLSLFLEKGAVRALTIDERNSRYDINISTHGHFMCKSCGKIQDVFDLDPSIFNIPKSTNFKIDTVEINYYGFCDSCQPN
jgi:Fe2+ or Zn2+ uptake regulation protein